MHEAGEECKTESTRGKHEIQGKSDTEKACKIRRESVTVKRKHKADKISQESLAIQTPNQSYMRLPRNSKLSI